MNFLTGLWGNAYVKYGALFLGGVAAGVVVGGALRRGRLGFRPLAVEAVSRGLDVKDGITAAVARMKEDAEDLLVEARQVQAQKNA